MFVACTLADLTQERQYEKGLNLNFSSFNCPFKKKQNQEGQGRLLSPHESEAVGQSESSL